jgi:hypothetical protein
MPSKPSWQIRRSGIAQRDGYKRWDQAYQLLLCWATTSTDVGPPPAPISDPEEKPYDGSSLVCSGLHQPTTPATDH